MYDINSNNAQINMLHLFKETSSIHSYNTRSSTSGNLYVQNSRLEMQRRSFSRLGVRLWNEIFKNISGLNINSSKTEGMWIGSFRGKMEELFSIKWPKTPIKALRVYFTYDPKLLKEKNFIERLDSIKKLMVLERPISLWKSNKNKNQILLDLEVLFMFALYYQHQKK